MSDTIIQGTDGSTAMSEQKRAEPSSEDATAESAVNIAKADTVDKATPSIKPSSPHLLTLPLEVRQEILRLALPFSSPGLPYGEPGDGYYGCDIWHLGSTDVLRTCHQLHVEGTFVMYSLNPLCLVLYHPYTNFAITHIDSHSTSISLNDCPDGCRRPEEHMSHTTSKIISPYELGMANTVLVRDWLLKICWNRLSEPSEQPAEEIQKYQKLVSQVVERFLRQVRGLRKVTVVWRLRFSSFGPFGPSGPPFCAENREMVLKPLRDLGVTVEEERTYD